MLSVFNYSGWLLVAYMLLIMSISLIGTFSQFQKNSPRGLTLPWLGLLVFAMSVMPIQCGDFIYYGLILQTGENMGHLEDFYIWLWDECQNYIAWRAVIWGGATILLILIVRWLKLNERFAGFIFVITEMFYFGTTRNMFGLMLMFFAVVVILRPYSSRYKSFCAIVLGGIGLYLSLFLHRSMYLYLLLLLPALLPFGKKTIKWSIIAFPFMYMSVFFLASFFLSYTTDEQQMHAAQYTEGTREITIFQLTNELICTGCYLCLFYIMIKNSLLDKLKVPYVYKFLARYSYLLLYLGFLFYEQETGGWLYSRFVGVGQLAMMFVIMYFFAHYPRKRGVKVAFAGLIYFILYQMLYISTYASGNFVSRFNQITL